MSELNNKKNNNAKMLIWLIPAILIFSAGFVFSALYDLEISQKLYNPENPFVINMEATSKYPIFLPLIFFFILAATNAARRVFARAVSLLCGALITAFMLYDSYGELLNRNWFKSVSFTSSYICLVICIVALFVFALIKTSKISDELRKKLDLFVIFSLIYFAVYFLFIGGAKTIWQRSRFDEMLLLGNFDNFTPWYKPFGNGGSSFPSGHTAASCGLFLLIILADIFPKIDKYKNLFYCISWAYIGLTAFSRVVIGRHFLSDTLASAALMAIAFFIMHRTNIYKKQLNSVLLQSTENIKPEKQIYKKQK